jgi:hypothetical protein
VQTKIDDIFMLHIDTRLTFDEIARIYLKVCIYTEFRRCIFADLFYHLKGRSRVPVYEGDPCTPPQVRPPCLHPCLPPRFMCSCLRLQLALRCGVSVVTICYRAITCLTLPPPPRPASSRACFCSRTSSFWIPPPP